MERKPVEHANTLPFFRRGSIRQKNLPEIQ
jgi:hypothetical protein